MTRFNVINSLILLSLIVLPTLTCNDNPVETNNDKQQWKKISALEGIDIWDVKIFNDEIFIAGIGVDGRGVIYKSSDAINWKIINPLVGDSLDRGVEVIDFYNGNLIACFSGKPVYFVTKDDMIPLTEPILNEVREMIVDNENNILIGTIRNYYCKYVTSDTIYNIYDSLHTPLTNAGCYKQDAIVPVNTSKLLKNIETDDILIGNYLAANHFITTFHNRTIDCFPTEGLSQNDKYFGCYDIIYANDTILAAGYASIKYLDQNEWKIYYDTLPKPGGSLTIATSLAYDNFKSEVYVAANYIGVIKWINGKGWITINEGLESFQGYYDFIPDIIYFKGKLLLTYGTSKTYQSSSRGAMIYSINN